MHRLLLAIGILVAALSNQASAQSWPTKAIKVVVPLTAGSASDVMQRPEVMTAYLGKAHA